MTTYIESPRIANPYKPRAIPLTDEEIKTLVDKYVEAIHARIKTKTFQKHLENVIKTCNAERQLKDTAYSIKITLESSADLSELKQVAKGEKKIVVE